MRRPVPLLLAVLALAAAPAAARAATVSVIEPDPMFGTAALSLQPNAGEVNDVRVTATSGGGADVIDTGSPLVAGTGCVQEDPHTAHCDPLGPDRPIDVGFLDLGDRNDRLALRVPASAHWHYLHVTGGRGDDTIDAGASRTTGDIDMSPDMQFELDGGRGRDTLLGGPGPNFLAGGSGRDTLRGRGGADVLDGDAPNGDPLGFDAPARDVIDGGAGRDEVVYAAHPRRVVVDLRHPAVAGARGERDRLHGIEDVVGTAFSDRLVGGDGPNHLVGFSFEGFAEHARGGDVIIGNGGNDHLEGTSRRDRLAGGRGNDRIALGGGFDRLSCGPGRDTDETKNTPVLFGGRCERLDDGSYVFRSFRLRSGRLRAVTRGDNPPDVDCGEDVTVRSPGGAFYGHQSWSTRPPAGGLAIHLNAAGRAAAAAHHRLVLHELGCTGDPHAWAVRL